MVKYYSQAGQDAWIAELFQNKTNGFFIDIGAYDGIEISNTYHLEKHLGWKGLCIEAGFDNYEKLKGNRVSQSLWCAVTDYIGMCHFDENDKYGMITIGDLNTQCCTLEKILDSFNSPRVIDYLSIDIEGGEVKALSGFQFDKYHINAITVEHNDYNSGPANKEAIYEILTRNNFTRVKEVSAGGLHFEDWYLNKNFTI